MLFFNTINIPLAVFTVVLRRFIDKFRASKVEVPLAYTVAGWVLHHPLVKPVICGYLFIAGLRYALKHFRSGNMVSITRKNLQCHNSVRNRCSTKAEPFSLTLTDNCRRRELERKKSWVLSNLAADRESQEKVLRYVASLTPQVEVPSNRTAEWSPGESNIDLSSLASNPYYEPRCSICSNDQTQSSKLSTVSTTANPNLIRKQTSKLTCPSECDAPVKPSESMETFYSRIYGNSCRSELSGMPSSLNMSSLAAFREEQTDNRKKKKPKGRASLRRKRIRKDDSQSGRSKTYRKTRSGRIYGGSSTRK